jgi:hypothetical protein
MWILLTEKDTVQPGDEYYEVNERDSLFASDFGEWVPMPDGKHCGITPPPISDDFLVRRKLTGWDAVEHVIDTEIPADSTQALKCLVRMLRAKTAPTDP